LNYGTDHNEWLSTRKAFLAKEKSSILIYKRRGYK